MKSVINQVSFHVRSNTFRKVETTIPSSIWSHINIWRGVEHVVTDQVADQVMMMVRAQIKDRLRS